MGHYYKYIINNWRRKYKMKDMTKDNQQYGAITEQGDLGLGFDIFNEQDQETLRKDKEKKEQK